MVVFLDFMAKFPFVKEVILYLEHFRCEHCISPVVFYLRNCQSSLLVPDLLRQFLCIINFRTVRHIAYTKFVFGAICYCHCQFVELPLSTLLRAALLVPIKWRLVLDINFLLR